MGEKESVANSCEGVQVIKVSKKKGLEWQKRITFRAPGPESM